MAFCGLVHIPLITSPRKWQWWYNSKEKGKAKEIEIVPYLPNSLLIEWSNFCLFCLILACTQKTITMWKVHWFSNNYKCGMMIRTKFILPSSIRWQLAGMQTVWWWPSFNVRSTPWCFHKAHRHSTLLVYVLCVEPADSRERLYCSYTVNFL